MKKFTVIASINKSTPEKPYAMPYEISATAFGKNEVKKMVKELYETASVGGKTPYCVRVLNEDGRFVAQAFYENEKITMKWTEKFEKKEKI